ncbi:MAG: hypothetical protein JXQ80_00370 [Bacteroidales bacterium]|nr:hypothetical protein [Bacteroidales bacterium]
MNSQVSRKVLKAAGLLLLTTLGLIIVISVMVSVFYEKALVRYMQKYLDEHLLTELSMDDVQFRLLKGFPKATIEISNAVLLSGESFDRNDFKGSDADTLLNARSVLLQFNLLKLLQGQYELRKIEVSRARINLLFDRQNHHNLRIWKSSGAGNTYSVSLRNIVLSESDIRVQALRDRFLLQSHSEKTQFRGSISNGILSGDARGDFQLHSLQTNGKTLAREAMLQLDLKMVYSNSRIRIPEAKMHYNKAVSNFSGEFKGGKEPYLELNLSMPKFGPGELLSLLPLGEKFSTGDYTFGGNGKLNLTVKGSLRNRNNLLVNSQFEISNGSIRKTKTHGAVSKIGLRGSIAGTNRSNFRLQIDEASADMGKGNMNGHFELSGLDQLLFSAGVQGKIDLTELMRFIPTDTLEMLTGLVQTDFTASGSLKDTTLSAATLLKLLEKGQFRFEDAGIQVKNFPVIISRVSGKANWSEVLKLDSLALRINETDMLVSGEVQQVVDYLMKRRLLKSYLEISTDNLNISKYLNQPANKNSRSGYQSLSVFPGNMYLKAKLRAGNFEAGKFSANDLMVSLSALKDSVFINHYALKFPDGSISGNALITAGDDNVFSIACNAQPQQINIQQLFTSFNNFSQHFILDKNMKGLVSGNISFFAQWDSLLRFIPGNMKAKGDFEIVNGELVQFEPMLKLSKYIDVDELRQVKFRTLRNTIYISDRKVTIPEMAIQSSAFNISASGQHTFDNAFDYRVNVLLSEVLFNKARKKKKEIDEFMVEETSADQTTIPLIIAGTPDDFDVKLDRKKAFSLTRGNLKNNGENRQPVSSPDPVRIEWEEPEKTKATEKTEKTEKVSDDFKVEWEDE